MIGVDLRHMLGKPTEQVGAVGLLDSTHFIHALVRDYGLSLGDVCSIGFSFAAHVGGSGIYCH